MSSIEKTIHNKKPLFVIDLNMPPPHDEVDSESKPELSIPPKPLILESNNEKQITLFEALLEVAEIEMLKLKKGEGFEKRSEKPIAPVENADVAVAIRERPVRKVRMNSKYSDSFVGEMYIVDHPKRARKDKAQNGGLRNNVGPIKRRKKFGWKYIFYIRGNK